jgi:hypothetical protein
MGNVWGNRVMYPQTVCGYTTLTLTIIFLKLERIHVPLE